MYNGPIYFTVDDAERMCISHFGKKPAEPGRGFASDYIEEMLDAIDANTPIKPFYDETMSRAYFIKNI